MVDKLNVIIDKEHQAISIEQEGSNQVLNIMGLQFDDPEYLGKAIGNYLFQVSNKKAEQ